jgi:hypothetical protein
LYCAAKSSPFINRAVPPPMVHSFNLAYGFMPRSLYFSLATKSNMMHYNNYPYTVCIRSEARAQETLL